MGQSWPDSQQGSRSAASGFRLRLLAMMGSWRESACPVCGARQPAREVRQSYNSKQQKRLTTAGRRQRQYDFNYSPSQSSAECNLSQKDLLERLYKASHHLFPSGRSSQASSQNNIYEDIADIEDEESPGPGSHTNSLYLCLSEGRRKQLMSHRFVDWDYDEKREAGAGEKTWRSQLRKSLTTTCSSFLEMIKSIF